MSNPNIPTDNANPGPESTGARCASGCPHRGGLLRAVLYTPIVLFLGALAALATFPELADHVPMIGKSGQSNQCPLKAMLSGGGGCSSRMSCSSGLSVPAAQGGCCTFSKGFCCPLPDDVNSASESLNGDLTGLEPASQADETPADAITAANVVDSETSSN